MGRPLRPDLHPWVATPSATATIVNGQSGTVSFDVSADVALFRSGVAPNYGFLIKKVDELSAGLIEFSSRESAHPPLLVGRCADVDADGLCDPSDGGTDAGGVLDAAAEASTDAAADASTCTAASCDDGNPCTVDACTIAGCTHSAAATGTVCGGSLCAGPATSVGTVCTPGTPPSGDDGNPCTFDVCDEALGITHPPRPAGTACDNATLCDGREACDGAGTCAAGAPPSLSDGNLCTDDACDPVVGVTHTPRPAGDPICSNGNACDGLETCNAAGTCQPGLAPALDDGDVCTLDTCSPATGVTHTRVSGCDSTPVQGDAPLETRASLVGRLVTAAGAAITGATFTVFDERASGAPRSDVAATTSATGGFKLRLTSFPESEPARSPPHRFVIGIDTPSTLRAYRVAYAHPGESVDLGSIRLVGRDPKITNIGPAGGTATDSQGRMEIVIPPGALATTLPIQITPFAERADFPAPLPASTLTMYGFEAEPSGTTFALPVTARAANYRDLPTTIALPIGSYDTVEGRWEHEGTATWDGARFSGTITHFSTFDMNAAETSDRILLISVSGNPNKSGAQCGTGSAWQMGGGSLSQAFPLPGTHARGDDLSLSLHYDSGLAGSRRIQPAGAPVTPQSSGTFVPGSLGVSIPGISVQSFCVARGAGALAATQPGQCVVAAGSCGNGGVSMDARVAMLGSELNTRRDTASNSTDASFGGWVDLPLGETGQLPSSGFVSQSVTVSSAFGAGGGGAGSACAAGGGAGATFGVSDAFAGRSQVNAEPGPSLQATRKVLLHHRFTSPYGAGWAVREVSRVFTAGDYAVLVGGDGEEEEFRPRARLSPLPDRFGEQVFARDDVTGEVFVAAAPGTIAKLDVVTGARTPVLSGLAFPSEYHHALAIGYVGGTRHFVIAFASRLMDIDASGNQRQLTTRNALVENGNTAFMHASVAARGNVAFYTAGDLAAPLLYRFDLAQATPPMETVSALGGDVRLDPRATLSGVQFGHPLGLAFAPDGSLYLADPRRNMVYQVSPAGAGGITGASAVTAVLGDGAGRQLLGPGDRQPARTLSVNQPLRLAMAEDGKLLVMTSYGVTSFDPVAKEAELLFLHGARDEIDASLAGISGNVASTPASFVALTGTSLLSRTYNDGAVRVDVDLLSSETDPTRTIRTLADGSRELLDTSAARVWRFDVAGRLVEQRRRTGETDFTIAYTTPSGDAIDRITNPVGGQWVFAYASNKLESITDPSGGRTQVSVNAQGDLLGFVEPDGEGHTFTYDAHHMASKTTSRGDRTAYTFKPDGTVATSTKPGGETYGFETVPIVSATYGPDGRTLRSGAYTDARGVRHDLELDVFGKVDRETYVADGVTRVVEAVRPATLAGPGETVSTRRNVFLRTSQRTMNGIPLAPPVQFDSLGRAVQQKRAAGSLIGSWTYDAAGWLTESLDGPAVVTQHYERDAAGHVTRIFDGSIGLGGAPTGRETTFTWRPDGQPATMTMHGVTTSFGYDDGGGTRNLLTASDTLGRTLTLGYDARGNLTSTSDGTASTSAQYDANNRLIESRDALGNATTLRYTHAGCGCSESDLVTAVHTPDLPAGVDWTMAYGAQGRLGSVTDPHGFTESYTYETTGEIASVKDRKSRTTTMAHDQLGRLLSMVDTLGRKHQRSYTVPAAGAWSGPSLTAASASGAASSTSLSGALRSGDYQLGVNAYDTEGFPAQISLYRDATFALGFASYFDDGKRLTYRADRTGRAIDSAVIPPSQEAGAFSQERTSYDPRTSASLATSVDAPRGAASTEASEFSRDVEYDLLTAVGSGGGLDKDAAYTYTRDPAGRLTQKTTRFASPSGLAGAPASSYVYRADGRLGRVTNADGIHDFTYDARGLLATQTVAGEGVYAYGYDALGRSTTLTYPDGHLRHQVFDDLGRITSRCYEYPSDGSLNRCYGAQYDAVGNPLRMTSPEGDDVMEYDALDRLTKVTREVAGVPSAVETYDFNALGALKLNAGVALDHQRPRLDGAGSADAAVPATLGAQAVTLDGGGRITSLRGVTLTWSERGYLAQAAPPIPALPESYGVDAFLRRVWKTQGASAEYYAYEGLDRIAIIGPNGVDPNTGFSVPGPVLESYLFAGIDHPLRLKRGPGTTVYLELDLAGNIRRLRGPNGTDLGGYRYAAFGKTVTDDALVDQPLRWKARWYSPIAGGIYDVRARQWSPELGTFLSIDEYAFHDARTTLWGWPGQSPVRRRDPFGRGDDSPLLLVAAGGALIFGALFQDDTGGHRELSQGEINSAAAGTTLVFGGALLAAFTPEIVAAFPSLAPFLGVGGAGAQRIAEKVGQCAPSAGRLADAVGSQQKANLVNQVLRGRVPVESLTPDERQAAADFFRNVSNQTLGSKAAETARLNIERAQFLEGESDIAPGTVYDSIARNKP